MIPFQADIFSAERQLVLILGDMAMNVKQNIITKFC